MLYSELITLVWPFIHDAAQLLAWVTLVLLRKNTCTKLEARTDHLRMREKERGRVSEG